MIETSIRTLEDNIVTPIDLFMSSQDDIYTKYFSSFKHRGAYYVYMKVQLAFDLRGRGYKLRRISEIILGTKDKHDTILHYLKKYTPPKSAVSNCKEWRAWIRNGLYPVTLPRYKKALIRRNGREFVGNKYESRIRLLTLKQISDEKL